MKEWREYVGLQSAANPKCLVMEGSNDLPSRSLTLSARTIDVECTLRDDQVGEVVEKLLLSFPVYPDELPINLDGLQNFHARLLRQTKAANDIARQARRGVGNTTWGNVLFYKSQGIAAIQADAPIIVVEKDGLFGVFKHPHFEKYGYIL